MHNKLSQSECANIKPIQKAIDKLKITCKNPTQLNAAQKQYCYLIKRDDNFNRKFPDKVGIFFVLAFRLLFMK